MDGGGESLCYLYVLYWCDWTGVLWCSNLNVINITISMRYLSSPIISARLVITTLGAENNTIDEYYCSVSVNIPHQEDED